ncbi:MAG: NADH-quinone oxidoreductase subunit J family protein [Pirellulaceae bacterium]
MSSVQWIPWVLILGQPTVVDEGTLAAPRMAAAGALAGWPLFGALALGVVALCLLLPATTGPRRTAGGVLALLSLLLILSEIMLPLAPVSEQWVFWALAAVTLIAAVAAVVTRMPVYTALWFALSLLGTAGLLLFDGAQFLSISTVAVYAGAILVMFLFVIMLAQPEGHAPYDRITWGSYTRLAAALTAALLVGVLTFALSAAAGSWAVRADTVAPRDVLHPAHMARFGSELFSKHLLSIEVVGALLLVALVGAISIMIQTAQSAAASEGKPKP